MCPQWTTLATRQQQCSTAHTSPPAPALHTQLQQPKQQTIGDYFHHILNDPNQFILQPDTGPPVHQSLTVTQDAITIPTPPTTPLEVDITTSTPPSQLQQPLIPLLSHQQPISCNKSNEPWGDMWAILLMATAFWIVSKNTGTLNPQNLNMQAITNELVHLNASVFVAQETNIHLDPLTKYQIKYGSPNQNHHCIQSVADWYKLGGTLLLTLNQWTSHIISQGSDLLLGRWAYQEFLGQNDQRIIVISRYCVCNQKFDAVLNTVLDQQICLLQDQGNPNPIPQKLFLTDLIT